MRKNKKFRMEFSKIILIVVSLITFAVTVFACVMIWRTGDLSPLTYLIPSIFAEAATGTAFYYRKAEAENIIKISKDHGGEESDL